MKGIAKLLRGALSIVPGLLSVSLGLAGTATAAAETASGRATLVSLRADEPINVDGDLSEWLAPGAVELGTGEYLVAEMGPGRPLSHMYTSVGFQDDRDFAAGVWSRWDDEYLYFAAEVSDDLVTDGVWDGDRWGFIFDTTNSTTDADYAGKDFGNYQNWLPGNQWVQYRVVPETVWVLDATRVNIDIPGAVGMSAKAKDGYTFEVAIPWSGLVGAKPEPGAVFGFLLLVTDGDELFGTRIMKEATWPREWKPLWKYWELGQLALIGH